MEWVEGKRLQGGQYIIEKVLGRGGFGITYLARTSSRQLVAIKTLNKMVQDSIDFAKCQKEFENEARRLQQCKHPHIVSVHDLFLEGMLWCIVMQYIPGETLASYVEKQRILSEAEALHYIRQISEALNEVHKNGLLHRDVKPRNIMLRSDSSEAVLIDFGAAREFTHDHTETHTELMSQGFAPYEQYFRKHKRGAYTDVYATAATLYFMVTGKVPPTALDRSVGEPLVPPNDRNRHISTHVNEAILKGMALKASDRPQSMQEWLKLLELQVITPPSVEPAHKVEVIRPPSLPVPTPHPSEPDTSPPTPQPSEPDTRSTRIIPWESLIIVFIAYVVTGLLLANRSAPLWVLAVSGSVAMAVAGGAAVVVMTWAKAVARGVAVAVVAAAEAVALAAAAEARGVAVAVVAAAEAMALAAAAEAVFGAVAAAGAVVGAVAVAVGRKRLLESFSRFHTFLILAATSELSLGLGWLVYLMIFPKR